MVALKRADFMSYDCFFLSLVTAFIIYVFMSLYDCFSLSSDCFYHFALTFFGSCTFPLLFHIFPFLLLSVLCSCHQRAVFYIDFRCYFFIFALRFPHFFAFIHHIQCSLLSCWFYTSRLFCGSPYQLEPSQVLVKEKYTVSVDIMS